MPDLEKILILKPFVDAWGMRNQRKAVKQAGKLMFWSDGMLGLLLKIAEGDKTKKTFAELKKKFTASEALVNATMEQLATLRGEMAGSSVARQIDRVLYDYRYGKSMIRQRIGDIIASGSKYDVSVSAAEVCRDINSLNSELERLHRMVYDK